MRSLHLSGIPEIRRFSGKRSRSETSVFSPQAETGDVELAATMFHVKQFPLVYGLVENRFLQLLVPQRRCGDAGIC